MGATTALFGVFRAVFLEPLPLPDPDELVFIMEEAGFGCCGPASGPDYLDWRERHRSLEEPERVYGAYATASTLELLGVAPILGRYLAPEDESTPGPVVLSHALWQRVAGGDRAVWGVVLGLLRVWATSSVVEGMVYGIESSDPLTILAGCLVLTGVAVAASAIPALRAAHVSPVTALRAE